MDKGKTHCQAGRRLRWLAVLWLVALLAACRPATPTNTPLAASPLPVAPSDTPPAAPSLPATPSDTPPAAPTAAEWPTHGWRSSTPEAQGMDSATLAEMFKSLTRDPLQGHGMIGLVVVRHGYLVLEAYFHPYDATRRNEIFSCTKSVTSMLVGIALAEGYLDGVDERVVNLLPGRAIQNLDARKEAMTLQDLLTMRSGLDWLEWGYSYEAPEGLFQRWRRSDDWVQFVLDQPMETEPGRFFNYNTGASHLLSAIVQQATQMSALDFARQRLFEPLGISNVDWAADAQGINYGGYGLLLTARDLARLGYLYLRGGEWDGRQIVPAEWVADSTRAQTAADSAVPFYTNSYGYQWWIFPQYGIYAALGHQGQALYVVPEQDVVAVFTQWALEGVTPENTFWLLRRFVLRAIQSDGPLPAAPEALALLQAEVEAAASPP